MSNSHNDFKPSGVVVRPTVSSGSSEGCSHSHHLGIEEKKRRRMESNRESARRSRQKKQQHLDDLIKQVGNLTRDNEQIAKKIGEVSRVLGTFEAQNKVLNTQKEKLVTELESLESVIEIAKEVRGSNDDNSDDPMMKPWQLPCLSMPIFAASSSRHCFKF